MENKIKIPENVPIAMQTCADVELTDKFYALHVEIVDKVIAFCKENNVNCDIFSFHIDGILDSLDYGKWGACTDSSCSLIEKRGDKTPFLHNI